MRNTITIVFLSALILCAAGCAPTGIIAHGTTRTGEFFGDTGITGNSNVVTIEKWSRLCKLSIIGNQNEVFIEEGVRIPRIEVFGNDNVVSIPHGLVVQFNHFGNRNRLVERERSMTQVPPRETMIIVGPSLPVQPAPTTTYVAPAETPVYEQPAESPGVVITPPGISTVPIESDAVEYQDSPVEETREEPPSDEPDPSLK